MSSMARASWRDTLGFGQFPLRSLAANGLDRSKERRCDGASLEDADKTQPSTITGSYRERPIGIGQIGHEPRACIQLDQTDAVRHQRFEAFLKRPAVHDHA